MVNSNSKTPASVGAGTSGSIAGAGSNTSGGSSTGGGSTAAGTSAPGAIPAAGGKLNRGFRSEITQLANGIGTQLPDPSTVLQVKGQSLTRTDLLNALAALAALFADVDGSRQQLKSKQQALAAGLPEGREFVAALKAALVGLFGRGNPVLENFGIHPRKARKLTGAQITEKRAKSNATRELRGTLGARQKQGVKFKGQVEVQTKLSGTEASGGNASPAAGNSGAPPAGGNAASGSGASQP